MELPKRGNSLGGTQYARDIRKLFPLDVQERIFNHLIDYRRLDQHLYWRLDIQKHHH